MTNPLKMTLQIVVLSPVLLSLGCSTLNPVSQDAWWRPSDREVQQVSYNEEEVEEEEDEGISVSDLAPQNWDNAYRKALGQGPSKVAARQLFDQAQAVYDQASKAEPSERGPLFLKAAKIYTSAAERHPRSMLEHDGLFMAGESLFFADEYPEANKRYERLLKEYPNSRVLDRVEQRRFAIARYWEQLEEKSPEPFYNVNLMDDKKPWRDTQGHARRIYDKIRIDDPTGQVADDATMALANSQFRDGKYGAADATYTDLRQAFPDSKHQYRAHFLGLKAKLLSYRGPAYSSVPLDGANELLVRTLRRFPREVEEEREYLAKAKAEIQFKLAEREWTTAKYYDNRAEFGAAKYHYNLVASKYSDTKFAERARDRVASLGGRPDKPPQRLGWLVKMFPEAENVKPIIATAPTLKR